MSITCPVCQMTSHNPNDEREKYCGNCHMFHEHMSICTKCGRGFRSITEMLLHDRLRHRVIDDERRD